MSTEDRNANVVLTADVSNYSQQMVTAQQSTNSVTDSVNKLLTSLDKIQKTTSRDLKIFSAATVATITAATVAAGRFEQQLSTLQARSVAANQSFGLVQRTVDTLRRSFPMATEQVVALAEALQKLGTNPAKLKEVADTLIKLSGATGEDLGSLANGMINLQRAMGTGASGIGRFSDLLVNLSAKMGTSATAILSFSEAIAPIGRTLNMTQQEVMGFSAAFAKAGQDGTRAASIFTRMLSDISSATRYGTADLGMYAALVGKTIDQFKGMGSTNQVMAIFDALNKGGAESIKTLERMGYEGAQSLKVIQGTVQSGSLKQALGIANSSGSQNGDTLQKAQAAAFDGLNDSITRTKNNMTSMAQAFGSTFLPIFTGIAKVVENMTKSLNTVLGPIMGLVGAGAAGLAGVTGAAGGVIGALGPIAAVAAGYALYRNSAGAGKANARHMMTGRATPNIYANTGQSMSAGRGSFFQRGLYAYGAGRGGGDLNRMMGGETTAAQRALYQAGRYSPAGLWSRATGPSEPGGPSGFRTLARRAYALGATGLSGAIGLGAESYSSLTRRSMSDLTQRGYTMAGVGQAWNNVRTAGTVSSSTAAVGVAMRRMAVVTAEATLGVARLGASAVASATQMVGRGIVGSKDPLTGMRSGGLMGLMGGPLGLAMIGVMGGMAMISDSKQSREKQRAELEAHDGEESAYNTYATSLGLAGVAAQTFADELTKTTSAITTLQEAMNWSPLTQDQLAGHELTNKNISNMSAAQASAYIATAMGNSSGDPRVLQAMQLDIQKQFGATEGRNIWNQAKSGGVNLTDLGAGDDFTSSRFAVWRAGDKTKAATSTLSDSIDTMRAEIDTRGDESGSERKRLNVAASNAIVANVLKAGSDQDALAYWDTYKASLGITEDLKTGNEAGISHKEMDRAERAVRRGDPKAAQYVAEMSQKLLTANNVYSDSSLAAMSPQDLQSQSYKFGDVTALRDTETSMKMRQNRAGNVFWGVNDLGSQLQSSANQEGNENAQLSGATAWAEKMLSTGMSAAQVDRQFQELKASVGTLSSPISQLATAAQAAAKRLSDFNNIGASQSTVVGQHIASLKSVAGEPVTEEQQKRQRAAEDQVMSDYADATNLAQSIVKSRRAFDLSQQYGQEDFDKGMARQADDYWRNQERSLEDFNLSRKQAEEDFALSRKRSEADFAHQKELMVKQQSKSMSDVYSRLNVQPTWDAQNLAGNVKDQAAVFRKQINDLKKLRKMGLSSAAIQMLGLTDPRNAQQVARMVSDLESSPELISDFNKSAKERINIAEMFTFDEDNEQWQEMERAFKLSADRQAEDFEKSMNRSSTAYRKMVGRANEDFNRGLGRMQKDFDTQMTRSSEAFSKQFESLNGDLATLQDEALAGLDGDAREQVGAMFDNFKTMTDLMGTEAKGKASGLGTTISQAFKEAFVDPFATVSKSADGETYTWTKVKGAGGKAYGTGEDDTIHPGEASGGSTAGAPNSPVPSSIHAGTSPLQRYGAPRDGGKRKHEGSDFPAPVGTAIYAALGGIAHTMWSATGGNLTGIDHGNGLWTKYLHQSAFNVRNGQEVDAGSLIGRVGNTGSGSRGNHLHFEVRHGGFNGPSSDPLAWLADAVSSGSSEYADTDGTGNPTVSPSGKKKWNDYLTKTLAPLEKSVMQNAYTAQVLGDNKTTKGTIGSTNAALNSMGYLGEGAIFNRTNYYGVGERGSEMVLPLDAHGSDFLADTMHKFALRPDERVQGMERVVANNSNANYSQTVDSSINFTGDVHVESNDPNEMARKLEDKARLKRLTSGVPVP